MITFCYCYDTQNESTSNIIYFSWACRNRHIIISLTYSWNFRNSFRKFVIFLEYTIHLVWEFLLWVLLHLETLGFFWLKLCCQLLILCLHCTFQFKEYYGAIWLCFCEMYLTNYKQDICTQYLLKWRLNKVKTNDSHVHFLRRSLW